MNGATLAVVAIIAVLIIGAIAVLINNRRKGKSSCGCNCTHCTRCGGQNVIIPENDESDSCKKG